MNQIFALNFGAEITQNYIWIFSTKNQIINFFYLLQNEIWVIFWLLILIWIDRKSWIFRDQKYSVPYILSWCLQESPHRV